MGLLFFTGHRTVSIMAFKNFNSALKNYPLTHWPTLGLGLGAIIFWLELYFIRLPFGHCSWLAWGIFIFCFLALLFSRHRQINVNHHWKQLGGKSLAIKAMIITAAVLGLAYLGIGLYASLLPPHLVQENDALTYHLTLPRQHLLRHSFQHIPWSTPDLFLLPLDYALSPFELATMWPNKWVQFIFFAGSLGLVFRLTYILSGQILLRAWIAVMAVMACHAIAIQVGLAMLDLVMLYCFLAFLHSLLTGRFGLAAVEFAFFFWSKSFIPFQMIIMGAIVGMAIFWALKNGYTCDELPIFNKVGRKIFFTVFVAASLGIALPHLIKSFYYTGTPFYPLGIGFLPPFVHYTPDHWHALLQRAADCMSVKDNYGHGRGVWAFIKHFWLMAVPEQGVNNSFDYPVGIIYLLVLAPFLAQVFRSFKSRKLPVLSLIVMSWWLVWWFGSQQSRFLLVPICLMIILTLSHMPKVSRVLTVLIILALGLETVSLMNAHRSDWGKPLIRVLRDKDKKLIDLKPPAGADELQLDFPDLAFAASPVRVSGSDSVYVIP